MLCVLMKKGMSLPFVLVYITDRFVNCIIRKLKCILSCREENSAFLMYLA